MLFKICLEFCNTLRYEQYNGSFHPDDVVHLLEKLLQMLVLAQVPLEPPLQGRHFLLKVR